MTIRVLIADDERLARERIRTLLSRLDGFEIIAECADGRETVDAVRTKTPDLMFLDVQMPELDGFGVLEQLDSREIPLVIFLTAYDHYAVRAFEVHALDYLLKPVDPRRLLEATNRVKEAIRDRQENRVSEGLLSLLGQQTREKFLERLVIRVGARVLFVRTSDIDWIEAEENYVRVHSAGAGHLLRHTLSGLEKKLDPAHFARIQRGIIVNTDKVAELELLSRSEYVVVLQDGTRLPLSSLYRRNIEAALGRF